MSVSIKLDFSLKKEERNKELQRIISDMNYDRDHDDYFAAKRHLESFAVYSFSPYSSRSIRFDYKRVISSFGTFGRDLFQTRDIDYKMKYDNKTKSEVITFVGKRNDVTLVMTLTKEKTYCSKFEAYLCDNSGTNPIYCISSNEEAQEICNTYYRYGYGSTTELKEKIDDLVKDPVNPVKKEGLEQFLADLFNYRTYDYAHLFREQIDLLLTFVAKSVSLDYDSATRTTTARIELLPKENMNLATK